MQIIINDRYLIILLFIQRVTNLDKDMLRCGTTNVFLKPECVCSFYNVFEAIYHGHSSCPEGAMSDIVTELKCRFEIQSSVSGNDVLTWIANYSTKSINQLNKC